MDELLLCEDYVDEVIEDEVDEIEAAAEDVLCDDGAVDTMINYDDLPDDGEYDEYDDAPDEDYDVDVQVPSYDIYRDNELLNYDDADDTYDSDDYDLDDIEDETEVTTDGYDIF